MRLRQLILRRVLLLIPGLLMVATIVFFALRVLPGDPARTIVGPDAPQAAVDAMREKLGLNQPIWVQYFQFIFTLARGDLGTSLVNQQPVVDILAQTAPYTVTLALGALVVGVVLGVPAGMLAAVRRRTPVDTGITLGGTFLYSVPVFYSGILLIVLFGVTLKWFPVVGVGDVNNPVDYLRHLFLPVISLGAVMAGYIMRVSRSSVGEVLSEEYIRAAIAKGMSGRRMLWKHALRNALIPIITVISLYTAFLFTGAILTETVFNRPGFGKVLITAVEGRDYTVATSMIVVFTAIVMVINLITDIVYFFINPTLRKQ